MAVRNGSVLFPDSTLESGIIISCIFRLHLAEKLVVASGVHKFFTYLGDPKMSHCQYVSTSLDGIRSQINPTLIYTT